MKCKAVVLALIPIASLALLPGCGSRTPKRDYIPALKSQLFKLQEAVKAQNRAAIDSLLSPKILENKQSSDSLLRYVYGAADDFGFTQFGGADIAYTNDKARIDAYVMDSTHAHSRPIAFYMERLGKSWLFTGFGPGKPDTVLTPDSTHTQ